MIHIKSEDMLSGKWADMGCFMSNMANDVGWLSISNGNHL